MKESKSSQGIIRNRNVSIAERRALNDSVRCRDWFWQKAELGSTTLCNNGFDVQQSDNWCMRLKIFSVTHEVCQVNVFDASALLEKRAGCSCIFEIIVLYWIQRSVFAVFRIFRQSYCIGILGSSRTRTFLAMVASMIGVPICSMDFFLRSKCKNGFTFLLMTSTIKSKKVK